MSSPDPKQGRDELLAILQPLIDLFERRRGWGWLAAALLVMAYAVSGITVIRPNEVGLVLRFGRLVGDGPTAVRRPGLVVALPRPIDRVVRLPVQRIHELTLRDLGRGGPREERTLATDTLGPEGLFPAERIDPRKEGYALTGDHNILQLQAVVRYRIADPLSYALDQVDPEAQLRAAILHTAVGTIGARRVDELLAEQRKGLPVEWLRRAQQRLDAGGTGLELVSLELDRLGPPEPLIPAFEEVQSASIEAMTAYQRAQEYRAGTLPQAEADARKLQRDAQTFQTERLARARADAEVFTALVSEYRDNPTVMRERLYREAVERSLQAAGEQTFVPAPSGSRYESMRITVTRKN